MISDMLNLVKNFIDKELLNICACCDTNITVRFTGSVANTIKEINPEYASQIDIDSSMVQNMCANVQYLLDNSIVVLFDENYITESSQKNFFWVETVVHEFTHVCDYCHYAKMTGTQQISSLNRNKGLYYWSEFHAKYMGTKQMITFVKQLPAQCQGDYIEDVKKELHNFCTLQISFDNEMSYLYRCMHVIGTLLAWEEANLLLDSGSLVNNAISNIKDYIEPHKDHISVDDIDSFYDLLKHILEGLDNGP